MDFIRFEKEGYLMREDNQDRKSTRLNSSHGYISYAVFCLKKKKDTDVLDRAVGVGQVEGMSTAACCMHRASSLASARGRDDSSACECMWRPAPVQHVAFHV